MVDDGGRLQKGSKLCTALMVLLCAFDKEESGVAIQKEVRVNVGLRKPMSDAATCNYRQKRLDWRRNIQEEPLGVGRHREFHCYEHGLPHEERHGGSPLWSVTVQVRDLLVFVAEQPALAVLVHGMIPGRKHCYLHPLME